MAEKIVVRQDWIESERGWGQSDCGYSLHLSEEDLKEFVRTYWSRMPNQVPDWYEAPCPWKRPMLHKVDEILYEQLVQARKDGKFGLRLY